MSKYQILNYREADMRIYIPKNDYYHLFLSNNICFVCIKDTPQGDVSFTHPNHMFL